MKPFTSIIEKWLRYFLNFCKKHFHPVIKSEQVRLFIEKLKLKKHTPQQCSQAAHAVSLFFDLQQPIFLHIASRVRQ